MIVQDMKAVDKRSSVDSSEILPPDYTPSPIAVYSGKGKKCFNHPGNVEFRCMIKSVVPGYQLLKTKQEKTYVLSFIVENIKARCDDGIGFVRRDSKDGRWYELSDDAAREKVGFTLRQAARMPENRQRRSFQPATQRFDKSSWPVLPTSSKEEKTDTADILLCETLNKELVFPRDRSDIARWLKSVIPPPVAPVQCDDRTFEEMIVSESKDFANPIFDDVRPEDSILKNAWLILSL